MTLASQIYFVQEPLSRCIKIGTSTDIESRLASLQTANPNPLRLLGVKKGGVAEEQALHKRLEIYRKFGEWFFPALEITNYIFKSTKGSSISQDLYWGVPRRKQFFFCPESDGSLLAVSAQLIVVHRTCCQTRICLDPYAVMKDGDYTKERATITKEKVTAISEALATLSFDWWDKRSVPRASQCPSWISPSRLTDDEARQAMATVYAAVNSTKSD